MFSICLLCPYSFTPMFSLTLALINSSHSVNDKFHVYSLSVRSAMNTWRHRIYYGHPCITVFLWCATGRCLTSYSHLRCSVSVFSFQFCFAYQILQGYVYSTALHKLNSCFHSSLYSLSYIRVLAFETKLPFLAGAGAAALGLESQDTATHSSTLYSMLPPLVSLLCWT